jgi:DNA-binding LacI/PurR family transcriptional regulator
MNDNEASASTPASRFADDVKRVMDHMREAIVRAEFPPGSQVHEDMLRAQTSASVRAVKQALRTLAREGLVWRKRHQGTFVAEKLPSVSCVVLPPIRSVAVLSSYTHKHVKESYFASSLLAGIRSLIQSPARILEIFNPDNKPCSMDDVPFVDTHELKRSVQGVITFEACNAAALNNLIHAGLALVAVDYTTPEALFDVAMVDHVQAGYMATRHAIDLGHKRVAYIGESSNANSTDPAWQDRLSGYYRAVHERRATAAQNMVLNVNREVRLVRQHLPAFHRANLPTAYVLGSGGLLPSVVETLRGIGVQCPEQVNLVAADNSLTIWEEHPVPRIFVDYEELGRLALRMLAARLACRPMAPVRSLLQGRLTPGEWTSASEEK